MVKSRVFAFVVFLLLAPAALGQRVVTTVRPPEGEDDLRFDVNNFPLLDLPYGQEPSGFPRELNFAPNILFTPDSKRAFVSYPGSERVMAFDTQTGEVLQLIQVGPNPGQLTMTPDGRTIAVISHFVRANTPSPSDNFRSARVGAISLIDVETYAVRTLPLTEVLFSLANNIVFSADGQTAFVASAGTDSLLRFDVATLTEMQPRLVFDGGTRPVSITMAPDESYLAVVLVGSSAVPLTEVPDSIQLVDPQAFRVTRSIVPDPLQVMAPDGTMVPIYHNFFATNNLAISQDGRFGVIADQENSGASILPTLTSDHALLIDMQMGRVMNVISVGGVASAAAFASQLEVFAVLTSSSAAFIDPAAQTLVTAGSSTSQFRPTTRPVFTADGKRALLPSPVLDLISVVDMRTGGVRNLVQAGLGFESERDFVRAGTLEMALSPDGNILAALNFNANTVDLLKNTYRFSVPEFLSTSQWFTGLAVTNNSDRPAEIVAGGVGPSGIPYFDDPDTEEEVEVVNPQLLTLAPGQQMAFTAGDLLETSLSLEGWLDLDSDVAEISSFFLTGDFAVRRLDGGLAEPDVAQTVIFPGVGVERGFQTVISIVNANLNSTAVDIDLVDSEGEVVLRGSGTPARSATITRFLVDSNPDDQEDDGLFPAAMFEEGQTYYVRVTSGQGVIGYLRYFDEERMASMNAIAAQGPDLQLPTRLYAPQAVTFGGAESRLNLVNTASETAMVAISLLDDAGQELAAPVMREMESNHSFEENLSELFQLQDPGGALSGWLQIDSDQAGVVGSLEIQIFSGRAMSVVPLQQTPAPRFIFSHVAEGFGFSTGISLVNPGQEAALVRISVRQPDGSVAGEAEVVLDAGHRLTRLLRELVGVLPEMAGGVIRVESTQPIIGLELFYTNDQETLAAVPAQPLSGTD